MLNERQRLGIRLANGLDPSTPHCEYCGEALRPKYDLVGTRIPKSGGFWSGHMDSCEARAQHLREQEELDVQASAGAEEYDYSYQHSILTSADFTEAQANAILELLEWRENNNVK